MSIDFAPYSIASLARRGRGFVLATVEGFEPAIFNTPDGRPPPGFPSRPSSPNPNGNAEAMIYTPINVVVDEVVTGSLGPGPGQIIVEGGTVGCFEMRVAPVPQVQSGSRYVFILTTALSDDGVTTLPMPKAVFAWPFEPGGRVVNTVEGPMLLDDLIRAVRDAAPPSQPPST